jgi:ATP-dependent 26S proteasome regulatory subunit
MNVSFYDRTLLPAIKAGAPLIQLISHEALRVHGMINSVAKELNMEWYSWNRIEGLKKWNKAACKFDLYDDDMLQSSDVLEHYATGKLPEHSILILEDLHPDLTENQPHTIRRLRNIAFAPPPNRHLILFQPFVVLPPELEKDMQVLEVPLPDIQDLESIYRMVVRKFNLPDDEGHEKLLEAALGLTIMEAQIAFAKAAVSDQVLGDEQVSFINQEKKQIIKKSGYLEYFEADSSLKDIGGLNVLKEWLEKRGRGFDKAARDFGLETPRGVLLLGIPGTGKSLTSKAIAATWRFPLLKLDMGKIYGGIVGQSESNIRNALQVAEAMAPCVLWLDEIEKGMAGMESSGSSDGGTTSRVLGTFLTWMQEKSRPVFVVATANRIGQLPPELLRKGRMDEIFFVDLPSTNERKQILGIHLKKKNRNIELFDLDKLAEESAGFSGAELEEVVKEALYQAFHDAQELTTEHIISAIRRTTPLSRTRAEEIIQLRRWAKTRAVFASSDTPPELNIAKEGDSAPKLKSEFSNPFIS